MTWTQIKVEAMCGNTIIRTLEKKGNVLQIVTSNYHNMVYVTLRNGKKVHIEFLKTADEQDFWNNLDRIAQDTETIEYRVPSYQHCSGKVIQG